MADDTERDWICTECGYTTTDKSEIMDHREETGHLLVNREPRERHPSFGTDRDHQAVVERSLKKLED